MKEGAPEVVQHLSREESARTVDEFFASFVWNPELDPSKTSAHAYLDALFEAGDALSDTPGS